MNKMLFFRRQAGFLYSQILIALALCFCLAVTTSSGSVPAADQLAPALEAVKEKLKKMLDSDTQLKNKVSDLATLLKTGALPQKTSGASPEPTPSQPAQPQPTPPQPAAEKPSEAQAPAPTQLQSSAEFQASSNEWIARSKRALNPLGKSTIETRKEAGAEIVANESDINTQLETSHHDLTELLTWIRETSKGMDQEQAKTILEKIIAACHDKTEVFFETNKTFKNMAPKIDPEDLICPFDAESISEAIDICNSALQQKDVPTDLDCKIFSYKPIQKDDTITSNLYKAACKLVQHSALMLTLNKDSAQWGKLKLLTEFMKSIINEEIKENTEILKTLLPLVEYKAQGLMCAYIFLENGYAEPSFLRWATGAILWYIGQEDAKDYKNIAQKCLYQLCQKIHRGAIRPEAFGEIRTECGEYTSDQATTKGASIGFYVTGLSSKLQFNAAEQGFTKEGIEAKVQLLAFLALKEILNAAYLRLDEIERMERSAAKLNEKTTQLNQDEEHKRKERELLIAKETRTAAKKVSGSISSLGSILLNFKTISEIDVNNDIIGQASSNEEIEFDLLNWLAFIATEPQALRAFKDDYKFLISFVVQIVKNILKSPKTLQGLVCQDLDKSRILLANLANCMRLLLDLPSDFYQGCEENKVITIGAKPQTLALTKNTLNPNDISSMIIQKIYANGTDNLLYYYFSVAMGEKDRTMITQVLERAKTVTMGYKKNIVLLLQERFEENRSKGFYGAEKTSSQS